MVALLFCTDSHSGTVVNDRKEAYNCFEYLYATKRDMVLLIKIPLVLLFIAGEKKAEMKAYYALNITHGPGNTMEESGDSFCLIFR